MQELGFGSRQPGNVLLTSIVRQKSVHHFICCSPQPCGIYHCCLIAKLCPTLCDTMDCITPGFPVLHCLAVCSNLCPLSLWMPTNYLILCRPLLLPSINIRVFSHVSALCSRWPKFWSFSFSISPIGWVSFDSDNPGGDTEAQRLSKQLSYSPSYEATEPRVCTHVCPA